MVYSAEVPHANLKLAEAWLHNLLKPYRSSGEVFNMDVDEAKMWITREVNSLNISSMPDALEKRRLLARLSDMEAGVMNGGDAKATKAATREAGTQTETEDVQEKERARDDADASKPTRRFDEYIAACCLVGDAMEVSTTDVVGQYRIWAKSADKETYHALLDYLKCRFRPIRLQAPGDCENVINGYRGVSLRDVEYARSPYSPTDCEAFVFHALRFHPSGKILKADVVQKYEAWGRKLGKAVDAKDLKRYLKESPHVLEATLWTTNGNGAGYYGLCSGDDAVVRRKASSTAKRVEKRDSNDVVVCSWTTISKAAQAEGVCAAKMSRAVKNNVFLNGHYFVHL
jgi:hypothetical protein